MTKTESVYREVAEFVRKKTDDGAIVQVDWLATEFLGRKDQIDWDDAPFYTVCAHHHIREIAKQCIGKYKPKPQTDNQIVLLGFEHLQKAYPVERSGERLLVPVHLLTDDELEARALEYEDMAKGCIAHAKEIRSFVRHRASDIGGAA